MAQEIHVHVFDNGVVLLAELMDWVESAAFTISIPAGCVHDPADALGLASFTSEMCQRGCGDMDSRQFIEALDYLGVDRSVSVTQAHAGYAAAMLADKLPATLEIYAALIRRPRLPEAQLEEARQVCLLELQSLEDELAHRCIQSVKARTYPMPWGRIAAGEQAHLQSISLPSIAQFHQTHYQPAGTIVSVAGNVKWDALLAVVGEHFADWHSTETRSIEQQSPIGGYEHIKIDSAQTHIGLAYPVVPYCHPEYFRARGAVGVLSDGMSSRLFTEVREKRGLCYTVFASYHSLRDEGRVMAYAGTTTERAQETLEVMLAEINRLSEGIDESELQRLKARVRSALIMQQEMTATRSGAMAADYFHLGRVRTMAEINTIIESLTCESVNTHLAAHPPGDFSIVTLGAEPLEVQDAIP